MRIWQYCVILLFHGHKIGYCQFCEYASRVATIPLSEIIKDQKIISSDLSLITFLIVQYHAQGL